MGYKLKQKSSLELVKNDDETIFVDDLREVKDEVISEPSFKGDSQTRQATFVANVYGKNVTLLVQYTSGPDGCDFLEIVHEDVPEEYEIEARPNFEFEQY